MRDIQKPRVDTLHIVGLVGLLVGWIAPRT